MFERRGERALVTGAAGPTGLAISRGLIDDGYEVLMIDIDATRVAQAATALGSKARAVALDVSNPDKVSTICDAILGRDGIVDVLVNNAGILSNAKAQGTAPDEWRRLMSINLDGAFYLSRALLPAMRDQGWGRIINMCSLAMKTGGLTAGTAYTTSKGGLAALTFSLARECARDGVTVNGIAPAYIRTPMVTEQLDEVQRTALLEQIPVGRFCEPEEIAHVVRFLVSPLAGFITGEIVDVNGGLHLD